MTLIRESRNALVELALWSVVAASTLGLIGFGCAAPRVRPDEMSAADHRDEAEKERAIANLHRALPKAEAAARTPRDEQGLPIMQTDEPSDTNFHLLEAARHAYHARQHQAAAAALEHFENEECRALPVGVRAACPMLVLVAKVQEIDGGVRIQFLPDANVGQIVSIMRCHLAYARSRGFEQVAACPLYVRGVDIRPAREGSAIDVTGSDLATTVEIRERIHEIVAIAH